MFKQINNKTPKIIEITGKEVVVQHNILLESKKNLSLQEYKLFMLLISKTSPTDDDFSVLRITASEFAKAIGIENSTYIYRDLQNVTKRLMERIIIINNHKNMLTIQTHLLSSVYYWYGSGYVDLKISEELTPYLLKLKRDFTQYKLSQISTLSSVYAIRIYELLKKHETLGKRTFVLEDLRQKLNIKNNQYKRFIDFKRYVLEIAKREINAKTDLIIDFKFQKAVRKIIAVEFTIKSKQTLKQKDETPTIKNITKIDKNDNYDKDTYTLCLKEIMNFGFSEKIAKDLTNDLDNKEIKNAIVSVKKQIQLENVKNPKAMLRTALKEKWNSDMCTKKLETKKNIKPKKLNFLQSISKLFQR